MIMKNLIIFILLSFSLPAFSISPAATKECLTCQMAKRFLGKDPENLGPNAKTELLGKWYEDLEATIPIQAKVFGLSAKDTEAAIASAKAEAGKRPAKPEFELMPDGTVKDSVFESYEIKQNYVSLKAMGQEANAIVKVDGKYYFSNHETGLVALKK
jgi:hypothetical protein